MDPYTLAYLAGHSDFSTTRRYVHPQKQTVLQAMERVRSEEGGHSFGHSDENATARGKTEPHAHLMKAIEFKEERIEKYGRGEWIRTTDLLVPNQAL